MENLEGLLFNRKDFAVNLEQIISKSDDINVIAINSEWGTGKTFFADKFKDYLESKNYAVLDYNAWKNDISTDPMGSIVGEISTQLKNIQDVDAKFFSNLIETGGKLLKKGTPLIINGILRRFLGPDFKIGDLKPEEIEKFVSDLATDEIKAYEKNKNNIQAFKNALTNVRNEVREKGGKEKVIICLDELDRCRPNYAVEVLERIKHFYDVPGYVFILFLAKDQLGASIKNIYGENIGSEEYLKRFFDLELKLPKVSTEEYLKTFYSNYPKELSKKERVLFHVLIRILSEHYPENSLRDTLKKIEKFKLLAKTIPESTKTYYLIAFATYFCWKEFKEINENYWALTYSVKLNSNIKVSKNGMFEYTDNLREILVPGLNINSPTTEYRGIRGNIENCQVDHEFNGKPSLNQLEKWCEEKYEFINLIEV